MNTYLSVLILSVPLRIECLCKLLKQIYSVLPDWVEVLISIDNKQKTIGQKRNELVKSATGKYVVFIDDDDMISNDYFIEIKKGIDTDVDYIGITGIYFEDSVQKALFRGKLGQEWCFRDGIYERGVQQIAPIKRKIALQCLYPEINFGEDKIYDKIASKIVKTEYLITTPIYYYYFNNKKNGYDCNNNACV